LAARASTLAILRSSSSAWHGRTGLTMRSLVSALDINSNIGAKSFEALRFNASSRVAGSSRSTYQVRSRASSCRMIMNRLRSGLPQLRTARSPSDADSCNHIPAGFLGQTRDVLLRSPWLKPAFSQPDHNRRQAMAMVNDLSVWGSTYPCLLGPPQRD
jgi:hypothetical protein